MKYQDLLDKQFQSLQQYFPLHPRGDSLFSFDSSFFFLFGTYVVWWDFTCAGNSSS